MRGSIDPADEPEIRKDVTCIPWEELQNLPARFSDLVKYGRASLSFFFRGVNYDKR
jgi:hypothetical protein